MVQGFLDHISTLLHSPEVEVSYFAAGILAHLTSRGEEAWTLSPSLRSSLLEQLVGLSITAYESVTSILGYVKSCFECNSFVCLSSMLSL